MKNPERRWIKKTLFPTPSSLKKSLQGRCIVRASVDKVAHKFLNDPSCTSRYAISEGSNAGPKKIQEESRPAFGTPGLEGGRNPPPSHRTSSGKWKQTFSLCVLYPKSNRRVCLTDTYNKWQNRAGIGCDITSSMNYRRGPRDASSLAKDVSP